MNAHDSNEKGAQTSLLRRLFSTEGAIFLIGVACMVYGVADGFRVMQFFFGVCIVGGSVALHFVRKKDWDAHWAEHRRLNEAHEQRLAQERTAKEREQKGA